MTDCVPRRATYDDVMTAPPNLVAELFDGKLYTTPMLAPRSGVAAFRLAAIVGKAFSLGLERPGGWSILNKPEIHCGDDVVVPDVAGWRRTTMPKIPDTDWFEVSPDWTCEVLTEPTRRLDRGIKRDLYARHGVAHLWHLDPIEKLLEVFELTGGKWLLWKTFVDNDEVAAPPFAAVPFKLGLLWAE